MIKISIQYYSWIIWMFILFPPFEKLVWATLESLAYPVSDSIELIELATSSVVDLLHVNGGTD